jgi:hypothetical protein
MYEIFRNALLPRLFLPRGSLEVSYKTLWGDGRMNTVFCGRGGFPNDKRGINKKLDSDERSGSDDRS